MEAVSAYDELVRGNDDYTTLAIPRIMKCYDSNAELLTYLNNIDTTSMTDENKKAIKKAQAEAYLMNNNYNAALNIYMELYQISETEEERLQSELDIELCEMYEQIYGKLMPGADLAELKAQKFETQHKKVVSLRNKLLGVPDEADNHNNEVIKYKISNYPNPFNPVTTINYTLGKNADANISVYNLMGQKVRTLVNETKEKGDHSVVWNGKDDKNQSVASGVYFYRLSSDGKEEAKGKMLLIK